MAVKFNVNKAIQDFQASGGTTKFLPSLKKVLVYMQNDKNINTMQEVAWLLATAKVESDYSLQRWESDFLCGDAGVPYIDQPCQRAINYYKSTNNKKNYFQLGLDTKGMAYFGRGLIQLTGKSNYERYGKLLGIDLLGDGDKAMIPKNSYHIASAFMNRERGSESKSVFDYANEGNFAMARKRVKGSSSGWQDAKKVYDMWIGILEQPNTKFKSKKIIRKERRTNVVLYSILFITTIGFAYTLYSLTRPNKK